MAGREEHCPCFFPVWNCLHDLFLEIPICFSHRCTKVIKKQTKSLQPCIKTQEITDPRKETTLYVCLQPFALDCLPSLLLHPFVASLHCSLFREMAFCDPSIKCLAYAGSALTIDNTMYGSVPFSAETTMLRSITIAILRHHFCYENRMLTESMLTIYILLIKMNTSL